MAKLDVKRA